MKKKQQKVQQTRHKFQIFSSVPICKTQHLRDPLGWQFQWEVRPNWCTQFETAKTSARDIQVEIRVTSRLRASPLWRMGKCFLVTVHSDFELFLLKWSQFSKLISSQPETKSLGHFLTSNFEPAQFHSSFEAARTWVLRAPTRYVHKSKYGQLWPLSHISPSLHVDERPQKQETNTWDQLSFLCLNRLNTAYPWWLAKFKYSWQLVVPVSFL